MDFLITKFWDLEILHWLVSGFVPLLLAILTLFYLLGNRLMLRKAGRLISPLIEQMNDLSGRTINNLTAVKDAFSRSPATSFNNAFESMVIQCKELYQGRWLPDPASNLHPDTLFGASRLNRLNYRAAAGLMAVGLLDALIALLMQSAIPVKIADLSLGLVLLPLVVGLAGALLAAASAHQTRQILNRWLQKLYSSLETKLPVFNDQAGLALLIDKFMVYDRQMHSSLEEFNATTKRLAESDMADGICRSIEQVLLSNVAPSIQQATTTLSNLAGELTSRQERGMQELAIRFATALSTDLAEHLQPLNKEIELMGGLMSNVKDYIEVAMRAMDTTREQSEGLLADSRQALQQMAQARNQLTADFTQVDAQIKALAAATSQMAGLFQGNEQGLSSNIDNLGQKMDRYGELLSGIVVESIQSMNAARKTAGDQQTSAGDYLTAMKEMLGLVRKETADIAEHSSAIGQQLATLNTTLDTSMGEFTQASSQYVRQTLVTFDTGLSELAERLARTTAEIRDAVDALPAALRQTQGQAARFDG